MSSTSDIEWTDATWKTCTTCEAQKPRASFGADKSRADGLAYVCRDCKNAAARAKHVRSTRTDFRRGWCAPTRNGDKKQARRRINYLVEQGRIPHPDDVPCMDCCDMVFSVDHRHEYDHARGYDGENQLYVEAVCSKCHHAREEARRVVVI